MSVYRSRILCIEIHKTIKNLNPEFINNVFKVKENKALLTEQYKVNLETPEWNQLTLRVKNLKVYGPNIWSSVPFHFKPSENLNLFKSFMKNWNRNLRNCTISRK